MVKFRFEDLEIWKLAIRVSEQLFDIADELDQKRYFKFAEQLRSAALSISNNIAEGAGSFSKKDFSNFLNISHRSVFENANIIYILHSRNLISSEIKNNLLEQLEHLSKKITNFRKSLY